MTKREISILTGLSITVFVIHVILMQYQLVVNYDGCYYARWFDSPAWRSGFPPMYPIFVRLIRTILNDPVLSGQIVSSIFGSLLVFPTFLLVRKCLTKETNAWMATAFIALNPLVLKTGLLVLSDVTYLFFLVSTVYLYTEKRYALTGIFAGLGYLTRPEILAVVGILVGIELTRKDWKSALMILSLVALIALPYVIFLRETSGFWTLTLKSGNFRTWSDTNYIANETSIGKSTETGQLIRETISSYPLRLSMYAKHIVDYAGYGIIILGIIGIFLRRGILLVGFTTLLILPMFGIIASPRFVIPCIAFLTMYAFVAIDRWSNLSIVLTLACGLFFVPVLHELVEPDEPNVELKKAGVALSQFTAPADRFLDRKPQTAFYAGGEYWAAPYASLDSILHYAVENRIRFIVVSEYVVHAFRHQLEPLLKVQSFSTFGVHYTMVYRDTVGGVKIFAKD